jgi:hypothetical protein
MTRGVEEGLERLKNCIRRLPAAVGKFKIHRALERPTYTYGGGKSIEGTIVTQKVLL